jgi:CRISPR-associated protein Cas5h
MEVLSFDVCGKMAHFRKYYANNTAMSYSLPPRTTVLGMLGAILGFERDSYYEAMASDKLRVGMRVLSPLKKSFHRLNFLSIQTPFEIVSGLDISRDMVCYRIFLSPYPSGVELVEALKEKLLANQRHFNLTLGPANFSAYIQKVRLYDQVETVHSPHLVPMHSAVVSETVAELFFAKETDAGYNFLEEELLPGDFLKDGSRELAKLNRTLFSTRNVPFEVRLSVPYYRLADEDESQNIVFLE